jgi:site-specific DNA-methyltransferase (adenine-specific)
VFYEPQMIKGEPYVRKRKANNGNKPNNHKLGVISESVTVNTGERYPSTVQYFQQKWRRQDQKHPTQKPVPLLEWLIKSYCCKGGVVLDSCAGCGTTGLAAINVNRDFICIELEPEYFGVMQRDLKEAAEKKEGVSLCILE